MAHVRAPQSRWMLSAGDALFRWRSYLPLGLLPLVVLAILCSTYPFGTEVTVRFLAKRTRLLRSHAS